MAAKRPRALKQAKFVRADGGIWREMPCRSCTHRHATRRSDQRFPGLGLEGCGDREEYPEKERFMSWLTILIIVVIVLLVLGFFGRGRFRA
ncbi:MAG: hypothetical protein ACXW0R_14270 [Gaiellaceae bacterium]